MAAETFHGMHDAAILEILNQDRSDEDSFCDATLQVDGAKFRVHRCLLGGLSDYFKKMFKCEMKEKYDKTISIEKFNVETIKTILDYFYTAKISISEENAISLLEAADYFQLGDVKLFCAKSLISSLTVMNCLHLRSVGDTFNCELLHLSSGEVVTKYFKKVIEQPMFKQLSSDDVESIIRSLDQEVIGGRPVYEGVLTWVSYDCEHRKEDFVKLFKLVKLRFLPTKYLEEKVYNQELVKNSIECKDHFLKESLHIMKHQSRKEPVFDSCSSSETTDFDSSSSSETTDSDSRSSSQSGYDSGATYRSRRRKKTDFNISSSNTSVDSNRAMNQSGRRLNQKPPTSRRKNDGHKLKRTSLDANFDFPGCGKEQKYHQPFRSKSRQSLKSNYSNQTEPSKRGHSHATKPNKPKPYY